MEPEDRAAAAENPETPAPEASGEAITAEGIASLKSELDQLEGPRRREMADRIKAARELGDLKENAEYHIAKDDQAHLETRISKLRQRLRTAVVVEVDSSDDVFSFGRTAEIVDETTGKVQTWTLVGANEADLPQGRLSIESPVGRALRDTGLGESVEFETPRGSKTYRVQKLLD